MNMATLLWFRVLYGPLNAGRPYRGGYEYGWRFPAPGLGEAWDTIRRVCRDWRARPYRVDEIHPADFDHPDVTEKEKP